MHQTNEGKTRLNVPLRAETFWQSLKQLADLFWRDKSVISLTDAIALSDGISIESAKHISPPNHYREQYPTVSRSNYLKNIYHG